ncbi:hypothetical protein DPMN_031484 [Dreissena polymorpha]|uniref:Uncharacterized protein n=1 Tax=Dreissena polymorpha TaxID=45954 RepID=A0A9D4M2F2_DREPO|nr:hypothetical protein DPMN_031484 [Dreissena polymorpha]
MKSSKRTHMSTFLNFDRRLQFFAYVTEYREIRLNEIQSNAKAIQPSDDIFKF